MTGVPLLFLIFIALCSAGTVRLSADYTLNWQIVGDRINIKIDVERITWVGFGFHPVGSASDDPMTDADAIIATFDSGTTLVTDYYTSGYEQPTLDTDLGGVDNVLTPVATQSNGKTTVTFARKLATGDSYDVPFTVGPMKVIWALGSDNDFEYHGYDPNNRGIKIVDFFETDTCGPTVGCTACLKNTKCVFCSGDNLCYDKTNTGICTPVNTTCSAV